MLYRSFIVAALVLCLLVIPGCLDDDAKSRVEDVRSWTEERLSEEGDLIVVRRSDLEHNQEALTVVLSQSDQDWSGLESLLALIGVGGVGGIVAAIRKLLQWRSVALEIITGMEEGKIKNSDGTYTLDKRKVRLAMSSATVKHVENIRRKVNERLLQEVAARNARAAMARADDPVESQGGADGPGPTTSTGG